VLAAVLPDPALVRVVAVAVAVAPLAEPAVVLLGEPELVGDAPSLCPPPPHAEVTIVHTSRRRRSIDHERSS
jgi:hypothetical protein